MAMACFLGVTSNIYEKSAVVGLDRYNSVFILIKVNQIKTIFIPYLRL
jgi:hypothetical protein